MKQFFLGLLLCLATYSQAQPSRPIIMLTGYWVPTNEMLRQFSQNSQQNGGSWIGQNWKNLGYDIQAYFPEFSDGSDSKGQGDFSVDWDATREDFNRITTAIHPIAIISFGRGEGPWELEVNAPDVTGNGPLLKNSLPVNEIASAVNRSQSLYARIDSNGDAGDFLCGFLSHLGAAYHQAHQSPLDPNWNIAQGFIHVAAGYSASVYLRAVEQTLLALISDLDQKRNQHE